MTNFTENNSFDAAVYQLATTDPVIGGPSGAANAPLQNLVNRTRWLYNQVETLLSAGYATVAYVNSTVAASLASAQTYASGVANTAQTAAQTFATTAVNAVSAALTAFKTALGITRVERAYVTGLSGTPTISGGNTTGSISRTGPGQYTWTFSTAWPNANYIVQITAAGPSGSGAESAVIVDSSRTVNGFSINCNKVTVGQYDPTELNLTVTD
jgi:hypothetical protein